MAAYIPPEYNQVNVSWLDSEAYTPPTSNALDVSWFVGLQCGYIPPIGTGILLILGDNDYLAPNGGNIVFNIVCSDEDTTIPEVVVSGNLLVSNWTFESEFSYVTSLNVSGTLTSSNWSFQSEFSFYNWIDITGTPTIDTGSMVTEIAVAIAGFGAVTLEPIVSNAQVDRGNRVRSTARFAAIVSDGFISIDPRFEPIVVPLGELSVSSQVTAAVVGCFANIEFSDNIRWNRGRVIYGYPEPPEFRQIYELSNQQSQVVPAYPEGCNYAIQIFSTRTDKNDVPIRTGTLRFELNFDHDSRDIDQIDVWVEDANGVQTRDKARIVDYPGGNYTHHILYDPYKDTGQLRIPVHCVNDRNKEFFLDVIYTQDTQEVKVYRKNEHYRIDLQSHFEEKYSQPYANLSDHEVHPSGREGVYQFIPAYEWQGQITFVVPDDVWFEKMGPNATPFYWNSFAYDYLTQTFAPIQEDVWYEKMGPNAPSFNTFFSYIYDDLYSGQIGG